MPCSIGIRFNPMSLAPTQMEQATCGNQVNGLLMNTVANSTGKFKRKTMPSTRHKVRCTGNSGVGGTNAISRPNENALMTRVRLNAQQPRSTTSAVMGLRYHRFSSAWRAGVMLLSQRCMNEGQLPGAILSRFRRFGGTLTRRRCKTVTWLADGGISDEGAQVSCRLVKGLRKGTQWGGSSAPAPV